MVDQTGIEPATLVSNHRENSPTVEENRLAGWSSELCQILGVYPLQTCRTLRGDTERHLSKLVVDAASLHLSTSLEPLCQACAFDRSAISPLLESTSCETVQLSHTQPPIFRVNQCVI